VSKGSACWGFISSGKKYYEEKLNLKNKKKMFVLEKTICFHN